MPVVSSSGFNGKKFANSKEHGAPQLLQGLVPSNSSLVFVKKALPVQALQ